MNSVPPFQAAPAIAVRSALMQAVHRAYLESPTRWIGWNRSDADPDSVVRIREAKWLVHNGLIAATFGALGDFMAQLTPDGADFMETGGISRWSSSEMDGAPVAPNAPIDFAILTAIQVERKAVCAALGFGSDQRVKRGGRVYWRGFLPLPDGSSYQLVVAQPSDMGQVEATSLTKDVLHEWKPAAAILVGIAASTNPTKVKLGDIVVGKSVWYYEHGKVTPNGTEPQADMIQSDAELLKHFTGLADWDGEVEAERPDGSENRPKIHAGVIASGEKVIADEAVRNHIASAQRKIIAIAMEDYGFSRAVSHSPEHVRHLVIRGVCDDGSPAKDDQWHEYAATAAAAFAKHFLLDRPLEPRTAATPQLTRPFPTAASATSLDAPVPRFEILQDLPDSVPSALALIRSRPSAARRREIVVSYSSGATNVLAPGDVLRIARDCQILHVHGHPMFPLLPLTEKSDRTPQGLLWAVDTAPYPGAAVGSSYRFAIGFDGSFAYSELMQETYSHNTVSGAGVGLFTCLDRLIGATLFARKLAKQKPALRRARVVLTLHGVMGQALKFDFDDGQRLRNVHLDRPRLSEQEVIQVAGAFDPHVSHEEIVSFGAQIGESITYYFGWEWQESTIGAEIRDILNNARQS